MAFGSTLTLTVNAVAKVLNKINQDSYGSEYYLREVLGEYRVKIRHSKESPRKLDGQVMNRHNVEVTHTVFATASAPAIERQVYFVFRNQDTDTLVDPGYLFAAGVDYVDSGTVQSDLIAWTS